MQTIDSGAQRRPNPFNTALAQANSSYVGYRDSRVVPILTPDRPAGALEEFVHDSFRGLVLNPKFACVAAKSAVNQGSYRMGVYSEIGSPEATAGLAHDLFCFVEEQPSLGDGFSTFVASFSGPSVASELEFEQLLWQQLQALHNLDQPHHTWDSSVSCDPNDGDFSFSFAGRAFFIVGLHAASSRWTRRFAWPTLVFNAHAQFERLRTEGKYQRVQQVIRARDTALQGSINANLSDFGERSEARQYSGRTVEDEWRCPFHTQLHERTV